MKKKIAVAITIALLAFPLSTALTMADTATPTPTTTTAPATTTETLEAVMAYEVGPITTLAEIATTEGLKAAAVKAVAAVGDVNEKTALELRITTRTTAIETARTALQVVAAVVAYETAPITTLTEVAAAEGLKAAAVTAVTAVSDVNVKTALELRITTRAEVIATAKSVLATQVVDANGNIVTSSTWFKELIVKLQLALSFDPARKGQLNERQALAKLAEAQKLMKDGKTEDSQICLNEYIDKIDKAQAFLDQVKDPNSETAKSLAIALASINSNNIQVLGNLIDKLPPQAAQRVALNIVRTMEKAVQKINKEAAKDAPETTPVVTPGTTPPVPVVDNKSLEKQAKVALENFKKSLNLKKIHIEDQDKQDNGNKTVVEQSKPEQEKTDMEKNTQQVTQSQPTHVTVAPVKPQTAPTVAPSSAKGTKDQNTQKENGKNKGADKE